VGVSLLALPSQVRIALAAGRRLASKLGIEAIVTSTVRTRGEQTTLYRAFLRGESSFPAALPGTSRHEFGLAVDMVPIPASGLPQLVEAMRSVGFRWAGPSDSIHFDYILPLGSPTRVVERPLRPASAFFLPRRVLPIPERMAGVLPPFRCCFS